LLSPRDKKVLILSIATLITLFFAKGNNPPFGSIYVDLVSLGIDGIYPFKAFYITGTVTRHILTIEYSILVGYTISEASKRIGRGLVSRIQKAHGSKNIVKKVPETMLTVVLLALFMAPLIISSWPIPTGEVMMNYYPYQKFGIKWYGVKIPEDYKRSNELIMKDVFENNYHPFTIRGLVLPKMYTYIATKWYSQGSSNFYNLYFEIPTVTGNFIPYGITIPKETIDKIYHLPIKPYEKTVIPKELSWISFQNDLLVKDANYNTYWTINTSSFQGEWHKICLQLPETQNWESYDYLRMSLNVINVSLSKLRIGIADKNGFVGWYLLKEYVDPYLSSGALLVVNIPIIQVPDIATFDKGSVTGIWLGYFIEDFEPHKLQVLISDIYVCKAEVDDNIWAEQLASLNIVYVIVDKSLIEGIPANLLGNTAYYIRFLNQSKYFKEIFSSENLLVYKNELFNDEIKIIPEHVVVIENSYITPTFISVKVNASDYFTMILPAMYSEGWCVSIVENYSEAHLPDSLHFRAYEILNGWHINKTGIFEIRLYYEPQKWFYFGSSISVATFLACLLCLTFNWKKLHLKKILRRG